MNPMQALLEMEQQREAEREAMTGYAQRGVGGFPPGLLDYLLNPQQGAPVDYDKMLDLGLSVGPLGITRLGRFFARPFERYASEGVETAASVVPKAAPTSARFQNMSDAELALLAEQLGTVPRRLAPYLTREQMIQRLTSAAR